MAALDLEKKNLCLKYEKLLLFSQVKQFQVQHAILRKSSAFPILTFNNIFPTDRNHKYWSKKEEADNRKQAFFTPNAFTTFLDHDGFSA